MAMGKLHANLGLFFQRGYYDDLTVKVLTDSSNDKKDQIEYFNDKNSELIESSRKDIIEESVIQDIVSIRLRTTYPGLVTGIGMAHATGMEGEGKLGMAFDYTSGLPYIPGSSVKGLLRSMFPVRQKSKKRDDNVEKSLSDKRQYIKTVWNDVRKRWPDKDGLPSLEDNDFDKLAELVFEGQCGQTHLNVYERDVFFDAQIVGDYKEKGILDFDYITPHKDVLKNPIPIKFLKILPNVTFVFMFKLHNSNLSPEKMIPVKAKKMLFEEILTTVGIGAKTNVGYGQLKSVEE